MAWLGHGIHVFAARSKEDVDGRSKPGHDGGAPPLRQSNGLLFRGTLSGHRLVSHAAVA
jgi:hypothetical protein